MYSLNNISFENLGITPGRVPGSNIAVSGMLDMPERIGKIFHDWTGDNGVQPYVAAPEIMHGGRSLNFRGYVVTEDKQAGIIALQNIYNQINSFSGLVPLVTPWGMHQVYIKEKINADYLQDGWFSINMEFEEPALPVPGILPAGVEALKPNIDGVAFESLGMILTGIKDHLNRPKIKNEQFTKYTTQGYQITPPEALEFELEIIAHAPTYATLKNRVESLYKLLASPGMRTVNVDGILREVFNTRGFKVSQIKVSPDLVLCRISLPLMMEKTGAPVIIGPLVDAAFSNIIDNFDNIIEVDS